VKRKTRILIAAVIIIFNFSRICYADEISELKSQLKAVQKQMQEQAKEIKAMQKKINELESKDAMSGKPASTQAESQPEDFRVYWKDGVKMETSDRKFTAHVGGRIHLDSAWIKEDGDVKSRIGAEADDRAQFRRARIQVDGTLYENFFYKTQIDFAGGDADFRDVYMGMKNIPYVGTFKVGQMFEPISLENLTSTNYMTFLELGLPNVFAPGRNVGIDIKSNAFDQKITWEAGFFRDADSFGDVISDEYNLTGRITGLPLYKDDGEKLVHVGANYSWRNIDDTTSYSQRPEANLAATFVNTGSFAAEEAHHFGYELAAVHGSLSLQGEFMHASVDRSGVGDDPFFYGVYAYASYFLTGERRPYSKSSGLFSRVRPRNNFSIKERGWGAWELAGRYSYLDLEDGGIDGGMMSDITVGLNWYLNPNIRIMANYIHSHLNDAGDADIFATRFQIDF